MSALVRRLFGRDIHSCSISNNLKLLQSSSRPNSSPQSPSFTLQCTPRTPRSWPSPSLLQLLQFRPPSSLASTCRSILSTLSVILVFQVLSTFITDFPQYDTPLGEADGILPELAGVDNTAGGALAYNVRYLPTSETALLDSHANEQHRAGHTSTTHYRS